MPRLRTRPLYLNARCVAWREYPYFINRCAVYGWQGHVDKTLSPCQVMIMVRVTAGWPYGVLEEPLVNPTNLICKINMSSHIVDSHIVDQVMICGLRHNNQGGKKFQSQFLRLNVASFHFFHAISCPRQVLRDALTLPVDLLLLFPLGRVEDELTSSWRRSRSQSRNSKASCCEFPRN